MYIYIYSYMYTYYIYYIIYIYIYYNISFNLYESNSWSPNNSTKNLHVSHLHGRFQLQALRGDPVQQIGADLVFRQNLGPAEPGRGAGAREDPRNAREKPRKTRGKPEEKPWIPVRFQW